jgi:hypothetical protein
VHYFLEQKSSQPVRGVHLAREYDKIQIVRCSSRAIILLLNPFFRCVIPVLHAYAQKAAVVVGSHGRPVAIFFSEYRLPLNVKQGAEAPATGASTRVCRCTAFLRRRAAVEEMEWHLPARL